MTPARSLLVLLVTASALLAGCTGGNGGAGDGADGADADRDEDGLPDAQENQGWGVVAHRASGTVTYEVTSDPMNPDTDGDGVDDAEEFRRLTDPREPDSDFDGLLDGGSVCNAGPESPNFDAIGILRDPQNPGCFLGERDVCSDRGGLSATNWDSDKPDGDGIGDGDEVTGWTITVRGETRRVNASPCLTDTDADGLDDGTEKRLGTDPRRRDTDGDGAFDSVDADPLADLFLRVTLVSADAADPPANATLRVVVSAQGVERVFEAPAATGLTANASRSFRADVDDTTPDPSTLLGTVILRATLVAPDGNVTFIDVGGHLDGGALARVEHDLVRNLTQAGPDAEFRGGNEAVLTGARGTVRLEMNAGRE